MSLLRPVGEYPPCRIELFVQNNSARWELVRSGPHGRIHQLSRRMPLDYASCEAMRLSARLGVPLVPISYEAALHLHKRALRSRPFKR